ncbi:AAA family ATPase [Paenisporosarcina cavernae]|uniref:AAA family ATPase n=2 Tax=Paenisporosarcina cavernae TaxID=2320858 RepID=A0A385YY01_9BACL|nr:sigma 54-interacting transcriptional regulator [Paenisporosarcina cavernae]AYC30807.1 AAA family ATPase [Paenisporosarcina cavernae]
MLSETVVTQILENAFQWFVVVDKECRILYINEDYCKFLEVDKEEAIGMPVDKVIENTKMHEVVTTGKEHIASPHFIKGTYMLANRVPLLVNGEIVGAFGSVIFRDMSDWNLLSSHVKTTMEKIHQENTLTLHATKLEDIKGSSQAIRSLKETIQMIAPSDLPVLIQGESGTGKELIASSIVERSTRSTKAFVKINCAAIPAELLELELLGDESIKTSGRLHQAAGGTLFIDEIGAMPMIVQAKLLRKLQEVEDVRIIAATNRPLQTLIAQQKFREDLYYRLQAITLRIPPLRERMEDLPELAETFLRYYQQKAGKRLLQLSTDTRKFMEKYHWPGNVREVQNVIQAAVYLSHSDWIEPTALPDSITNYQAKNQAYHGTLQEELENLEKQIISQTLHEIKDKTLVAERLGLSRSTLYEKIKKYNL